jgi:hypothetical protein
LHIDTDLLDAIFHIVDFPQTREEAVAFSKLGHTLNMVFDVTQSFRSPTAEDDDDIIEALQSQEQPLEADQEGNDFGNEEKSKHRLEQLLNARSTVAKTNPLRHLAVQKLDYVNW